MFSLATQFDIPIADIITAKPDLLNEDERIDLIKLADLLKSVRLITTIEMGSHKQAVVIEAHQGVKEYYYL